MNGEQIDAAAVRLNVTLQHGDTAPLVTRAEATAAWEALSDAEREERRQAAVDILRAAGQAQGPAPEPAGAEDVMGMMRGVVGLAAKGISWGAFARYSGLDPEGLREVGDVVGQEPFELWHGGGTHAVGKLRTIGRKLSASERKVVAGEIGTAFELGAITGMGMGRAITAHDFAGDPPEPS